MNGRSTAEAFDSRIKRRRQHAQQQADDAQRQIDDLIDAGYARIARNHAPSGLVGRTFAAPTRTHTHEGERQ